MTASLIDGKIVAGEIKSNIKQVIAERTLRGHRPPGLAVILLGDNPAASIYVHNKRKVCNEIGAKMVDGLGDYSSSWSSIENYEIEISEGRSLNDVIKFYNHFIDHCDELDDDEGADKQIVFEFDGELARKIEKVVEHGEPIGDYLRDLLSRHDLYIDWEFIDAIKKNLL